ncbi:MAG: DUF58 domain-containing protein [Pseudomonadota bacterium]
MSTEVAHSALLTVEMERRLAGLSFPMRQAMRSRVLGQHRSRQVGSSIEFSEHKEYHPGDDLRRVNWKAYGRLDRFYIKHYVQEASAAAMILLDTSGSMYIEGADGAPKVRYAAGLGAALAYVLLHQGDKVGMLHATGSDGFEAIVPHRQPAHYHRLLEALGGAARVGATPDREDGGLPAAFGEALRVADLERWHDTAILVFSDFLYPFDELLGRLGRLGSRNNRVYLFHVIHPEEYAPTLEDGGPDWTRPGRETFPYRDMCRFRSPETGVSVLADPRMVRREYLSRYAEFLEELRGRSAGAGIAHIPVSTGEPVDRFLVRYLRGG